MPAACDPHHITVSRQSTMNIMRSSANSQNACHLDDTTGMMVCQHVDTVPGAMKHCTLA